MSLDYAGWEAHHEQASSTKAFRLRHRWRGCFQHQISEVTFVKSHSVSCCKEHRCWPIYNYQKMWVYIVKFKTYNHHHRSSSCIIHYTQLLGLLIPRSEPVSCPPP